MEGGSGEGEVSGREGSQHALVEERTAAGGRLSGIKHNKVDQWTWSYDGWK